MKTKFIKICGCLAISIIVNLILASSAWGSVTISGLTHFKYDVASNHDYLEANFFFNSKISDNTNAYTTLQYMTSSSSPESIYFSYGTIYFTYKMNQDLGTFTVGYFENNLSSLVFLTNTVDKLRSTVGVKFERGVVPNLSFKLGYFPNEQLYSTEASQPQTATAGIAYTGKYLAADLNAVKTSKNDLLSGTANLSYKLSAGFKAYAHYCMDYDQTSDEILGFSLVISPTSNNPLSIYGEYNFTGSFSATPGSVPLGFGITYRVAKGITLCYYRYLTINEFRISMSWW